MLYLSGYLSLTASILNVHKQIIFPNRFFVDIVSKIT